MSEDHFESPQFSDFDGRNIDPKRAILSGEGSSQSVARTREPFEKLEAKTFKFQPSIQSELAGHDPTYFERPLLKKSPWTWDIPAYYYVGGAAGASATLGAAAILGNRHALPNLIRHARWIAPAGAAISAVLLIHDLGRPSRFLNMLRVFRPTSPMSVGSHLLGAFSTLAGISWLSAFFRPLLPLSYIANILSGTLGVGVAGYTGVLIANTAVPIWRRPHRLLPVVFIASGATAASSLLVLFDMNPQELRAINIFGTLGKVAEIAASTALEIDLLAVPEISLPMRTGASGFLWKTGKYLTIASAALGLWPKPSRKLRVLAGILGTAGALCARFGVHYAGQRSAMNPRASFHQQRRGHGAAEVTGRAAVVGPGDIRAAINPPSS